MTKIILFFQGNSKNFEIFCEKKLPYRADIEGFLDAYQKTDLKNVSQNGNRNFTNQQKRKNIYFLRKTMCKTFISENEEIRSCQAI